jgi:hypothetical protein
MAQLRITSSSAAHCPHQTSPATRPTFQINDRDVIIFRPSFRTCARLMLSRHAQRGRRDRCKGRLALSSEVSIPIHIVRFEVRIPALGVGEILA